MVVFALWLVRHGQTFFNKQNIIQGHLDVPLSPIGFEQAKMVGVCLQDQKFTHVYSSDLLRARQTAEEIIKWNLSYNGMITCDSRLRERRFGECEGKTAKHLKELAAHAGKSLAEYNPSGGETLKQMYERVVSFFGDLCQTIQKESERKNTQVNQICELKKSVKLEDQLTALNIAPKVEKVVDSNNVIPKSEVNNISLFNSKVQKNAIVDSEVATHSKSGHELSSRDKTCWRGKFGKNSCQAEEQKDGVIGIQPEVGIYANIMLVSHGGFLKELLRHLFVELSCEYNGKRELVIRITPNGSISKFIVSIDETKAQPKVSCVQLHYRQHLAIDSQIETASRSSHNNDDETAL